MSDSMDLRKTLQAWPYDPEQDARVLPGEDGRQIVQVRTPLGIEQYEVGGRPDGARPLPFRALTWRYFKSRKWAHSFSDAGL